MATLPRAPDSAAGAAARRSRPARLWSRPESRPSLRLGNTDGSNRNYTIIIDTAAIERSAHSANWSYRQLLAEVLVHELMHVAYDMDPERNLSAPHELGDALYPDAWDLYNSIFRVKAQQNGYDPDFDGALQRCLQD